MVVFKCDRCKKEIPLGSSRSIELDDIETFLRPSGVGGYTLCLECYIDFKELLAGYFWGNVVDFCSKCAIKRFVSRKKEVK